MAYLQLDMVLLTIFLYPMPTPSFVKILYFYIFLRSPVREISNFGEICTVIGLKCAIAIIFLFQHKIAFIKSYSKIKTN